MKDDARQHVVDPEEYFMDDEMGCMLKETVMSLPLYFKSWNDIAASLPQLMMEKKVRETVNKMPVLNHNMLVGHRQLRLAHLQLGFITAGYVWEDGDKSVPKSLPECLAVPYYRISRQLGVQPILSHVDLALANWALIDPKKPRELDNLKCLYHLPGKEQGDWFCKVVFLVEFDFAQSIKPTVRILDLLESIHKKTKGQTVKEKEAELVRYLEEITTVIQTMQASLARMHDNLDASTFFNVIRPFITGWGGEGNPLPDGLIYKGISNEPMKLAGDSAAQSSTLQTIDALLGVEHTAEEKGFLENMRTYMLPRHRSFIEKIENVKFRLRSYVQSSHNPALTLAYNRCLAALIELRNYHIQIVTKYIVSPSKSMSQDNKEKENQEPKGTGGTNPVTFLKAVRDDTKKKKLSTTPSRQPSLDFWVKSYGFTFLIGASATLALGFMMKYFIPK